MSCAPWRAIQHLRRRWNSSFLGSCWLCLCNGMQDSQRSYLLLLSTPDHPTNQFLSNALCTGCFLFLLLEKLRKYGLPDITRIYGLRYLDLPSQVWKCLTWRYYQNLTENAFTIYAFSIRVPIFTLSAVYRAQSIQISSRFNTLLSASHLINARRSNKPQHWHFLCLKLSYLINLCLSLSFRRTCPSLILSLHETV